MYIVCKARSEIACAPFCKKTRIFTYTCALNHPMEAQLKRVFTYKSALNHRWNDVSLYFYVESQKPLLKQFRKLNLKVLYTK